MSAANTSNHAPLDPITSNDHGGYVIFTIYGSLFVTLAFWLTRLAIRWRRLSPRWDDLFLVMAFVFAVAQTVCLQLAVSAGMGKRGAVHSDHIHLIRFEQLYYAAQLINILSQSCSKTSVNMLFHYLQPFRALSIASSATFAFTAAWAVASFLALAFQCDLPYPWKLGAGRCTDLQALNTGIDIVNIVSEACLILLPLALMPIVQTSWTVRMVVIGCFAARIAVIATLIGHITTSSNLTNYADSTWAYLTPTIWSQITMNVSILTACVPGMQQILAEMRPGMTVLTVTAQQAGASKSGSIFGSNSERAKAAPYKSDGGKLWEMSRLDESSRTTGSRRGQDVETESQKGLTSKDIVVTREFSCLAGD